jgi:cytoskeleton protein RodZ
VAEGETEIGKRGVGAYLRSVRESRGLQLDDASKVTKISKTYLSAIEEDDFAKLPNPAYIKGFLRLYASYLSLSGDDVVQRYDASVPPVLTPAIEHGPQHPGVQIVERAKLGGHGRWVVPALLLVLVVLAAVFLSEQEGKQPRPAAQAPQAPEAPAPAPAPAPAASAAPEKAALQPQRSSAVQPPGTAPARTETTATAAPGAKGSGVVLKLRFNRDTWLSITIDDSISQRYDLKAGDVIEWKGSRDFVLDLGDGSAVEAELNGKPLKTLGEPGKPAHVELKAP